MTSSATPARLRVRKVRDQDVSSLTDLLNAIIDAGGTTAIEERLSPADFADWFVSGDDVFFCHVAEDAISSDLLGFQALSRHHDLAEGWGDIATFARLRDKVAGIGTNLFSHTVQSGREANLTVINAAIRADNVGGLAYYDKMGFVTYRTLPQVPLMNGTPVDRILKRYDIVSS